MPHCDKCNKDFKRDQDLRMHDTKVHTRKRKMKHASKKLKFFKGSRIPQLKREFSKADLVAVIKVKIDSLKDVLQMLENL